MKLLIRYSNDVLFDKIIIIFEEIKELIEGFKIICEHKDILMNDIVNVISNHKKQFIENTKIKDYLNKLNINVKEFQDPVLSLGVKQKFNKIFAKPIDKSNLISIIDLYNKNIYQYETNIFFIKKIILILMKKIICYM